ncbi:MAG: protein serine/threonine phosphatase 2C family protein [Gammaproteobacteria bacterium]|nr:protein serine/threonine phosphatase 2C family protein [Gammaproteobacteria bacterium]
MEDNRVKGILNLSRSLGDLEYKSDSKLKVDEQMITCIPEIKVEPRNGQSEVLLLACDGIWDCLSSQEGIEFCQEWLKIKRDTLSPCLEAMFDKIIASDVASSGGIGCDNMTAILIQLKN